jgi:photosystem II stability/assembly factor-like uncharacterized protein
MRLLCWVTSLLFLAPLLAVGQGLHESSGPWVMERSGTTAGLRGIHAVGGGVAWASGTNGTVLRTEDAGYEWQSCGMPPGAEKLDFRGIWAWDDNTAIVMSSGPGDQSRLYETVDGCSHWKLLFTNPDKDGFWDAIQCADNENCMLLGDPVGGKFALLRTRDGGNHWRRVADPGLRSESGEGAFAASNSSLSLNQARGFAFFGTGGISGAELFSSCESCRTSSWEGSPAAVFGKGSSAGIFSLGSRSSRTGEPFVAAVGGDYTKPSDSAGTAAWSADGGKTWTAATKPPHGYRSAVTWDGGAKAWIAVGTNGSDISYDDGKTWVRLDDGNWNALSLPWVVGPHGRIAKLDAGRLPK